MRELKYSPAPWRATTQGGSVMDATNTVVAFVSDKTTPIRGVEPAERRRANARLIAAAPDLLAALWAILYADQDNHIPADLHRQARAAIAKATGELDADTIRDKR